MRSNAYCGNLLWQSSLTLQTPGRPDSVVKTEKAIYIVEFKYGQSAEAALRQCREKRYADAYADDPRRVVYVGVNYDPAARTIGEVKTEAAR